MQRFTDLKVWQRSHLLALRIYVLSQGFPDEERFGLTSQLRRAVTSVPSNIAEGSKRLWPNDYSRFLNIAQGSALEVHSLLLLARDLGFVAAVEMTPLLEEVDHVSRMLEALRQKVDRDGPKPVVARRGALPKRSRPDASRSTTAGAHAGDR